MTIHGKVHIISPFVVIKGGVCWENFPGCNNTPSPRGTQSGSIGAILQNFKSVATRRVNRITRNSGTLWQRNYHEEIIRNEKAYDNTRRYIMENPLSWDEDEENPLKFKPIS
jgi:hypothetical protein